jgi:glycosyltransferase involved in cell wall biosynthesis
MNILWINNKASFGGGAEQYIYDTVKHLNEKGIKSSLLYDPNIEVDHDFLDVFESAFPLVLVKEQIQQISPDIIYIHQLHDYDVYKNILETDVKKIRFYHDHKLFCLREHKYTAINKKTCSCKTGLGCYACLGFISKSENGIKLSSLAKLKKLQKLNSNLDGYIVASNYMKKHLTLHNFDEKKIFINQLYTNRDPNFKTKVNFTNSKTLLFVGQLLTGKGIDILIRAMKDIDSSYNLKIIGTGAQEEQLKQYTQELGLDNRVEFIGRVKQEELIYHYQEAYCLVVPSRTPETFNLTGIEALSAGLPVIAANVGGITEWLRDDVNGLLFESNNAQDLSTRINYLISNPHKHQNYCFNAFKSMIYDFKSETHINNLITTFNQYKIGA